MIKPSLILFLLVLSHYCSFITMRSLASATKAQNHGGSCIPLLNQVTSPVVSGTKIKPLCYNVPQAFKYWLLRLCRAAENLFLSTLVQNGKNFHDNSDNALAVFSLERTAWLTLLAALVSWGLLPALQSLCKVKPSCLPEMSKLKLIFVSVVWLVCTGW